MLAKSLKYIAIFVTLRTHCRFQAQQLDYISAPVYTEHLPKHLF